jgi:N-sulfoglucosamine sulfohydrolase
MQDLWQHLEEGELNEVQMQWFTPRHPELLLDTRLDPHEINNLAEHPQYQDVLNRTRAAYPEHRRRVYDYSAEMTGIDMAELFCPGGQQPSTAPPVITKKSYGAVAISSETNDASIAYRIDDGNWQLYTGPFSIDADAQVAAKAVRYSWATCNNVE